MRPASRVVDRFRPGPFVFAPIAQSETWRRASSPTPRQSGGGGGDPEQRLHFRRAVLPGSAISVGTTLVVVDDWTRFDQRGGVRVVAAEATGASRCSLKVVLVLAAGVSTGYGSRSAPGLRWPTSRYRRSWAGSSVSGAEVRGFE